MFQEYHLRLADHSADSGIAVRSLHVFVELYGAAVIPLVLCRQCRRIDYY